MALIISVPLFILVGVASSAPTFPAPLAYVALSPLPENIYNQVQDTRSGEYAFGYAGGPVAREEARTSDGVTRGAYSYVDAHGIVQYYRYIADDDGFRVVGTNIPTDGASRPQLELETVKIEPADAEDLPEKLTEPASSRKKRSATYSEVPVANAILTTPVTIVGAASVPTATSSQSRVQIHNSVKTEIQHPAEAIPVETVAAVPATPVAVKSVEAVPVAVVASVPTATSSQSRFQIHKSLKTEIHDPIEAIPVETVTAIPADPVEASVSIKKVEAIPVTVAEFVSTAESSQSHSQTKESVKTVQDDTSAPLAEQTIATVPASPSVVAAVPVAAKAIPVPPIAVASVPTSTSSQHRFQIHTGLKTEIHEPHFAIPVAVEPEIVHHAPLVPAISADTRTIAAIPAAVPTSVATSTSNQQRLQVHSGAKVEYEALPQSLGYKVVNLQPVISLQPANSFSHPSLARHQVGVGLGVLPSPILAYHNYVTELFAEA